jgi:hypothetical protein
MTTKEAAAELDVLPGQVARLIRKGRLLAVKDWSKYPPRWKVNGQSVRKLRRAR